MREICQNAYNFGRTIRGQIPHTKTGISSNMDVMRHDGPWFTTSLETGTTINQLKNRRDANNMVAEYSKVRYSCDEFPPATWVEGGDNVDRLNPAETRCAGLHCGEGVKAEQDWQATAHGILRQRLLAVADRANMQYAKFPYFDKANSVVLFGFNMDRAADDVAARIWTYEDPAMSQYSDMKEVLQARAENGNYSTGNFPGRANISFDELRSRIMLGHGTEIIVPANDSVVSSHPAMTGLNMPDIPFGDGLSFDEHQNTAYNQTELIENARDHVNDSQLGSEEKLVATRQAELESRFKSAHITPLLKKASAQDVAHAETIVDTAINKSSQLNKAHLASPLRNKYGLKPGTVVAGGTSKQGKTTAPPPLLYITDEIAQAAALVAESDARKAAGNTTRRAAAVSGTYWMGSLARKGTVPWGNDPEYKVFRNVLDYGAIGDGITDDTNAIKKVMTDGKRCGIKCNGSTTKNAIVYFPPGKYLVSTTIPLPFGTQVIGDANDRPTIMASQRFIGLGVLSTDEYTGGGVPGPDGNDPECYINTANFYRQIRNVIIDVTLTRDAQMVCCLHYQVAQATSLQNVKLVAKAGSSQIGIYAENGSGGQISDVEFNGGAMGIYGGSQQFTAQRWTFDGCTTGVQVIWDWGWVWKSTVMTNVDVGFKLLSDDGSGHIGSVSIIDSSFTNIGTAAVLIAPPSSTVGSGSTGVTLESVVLSGVAATVKDADGKIYLDGSSAEVDQWSLGPVYEGSTDARSFSEGGKIGNYRRHSTLVDDNGKYFERARPQYEDHSVDDFLHIKDLGATGDGSTDDTASFQAAVYASQGKILFVDAGSYILTSTVTIPPGSKIVGETWSQLVASGSYFEDASNPKVMLKVGKPGEEGGVELQDLIFTTRGPTAGAILVEWNIKAASAGSAGLWDCHSRIGGATGTKLTPTECPAVTSGIDQGCSAASLMIHLTSSGSGYFENMWLWGSDHMIDNPDLDDPNNGLEQNSIYVARGFLIESTQPTWLYATASEHAVFYQYNFHRAVNIFAGLLQTESPYFQPTPPPPAPFAGVVGKFAGDPTYTCDGDNEFSGCDESWAVIVRESENIFVASARLYSWFSSYAQDCIDSQTCQKALLFLESNYANIRFQNLVTIGAKYMAVMNGKGILAADNLNVKEHPNWSQISILDVTSDGAQFNELVWINSSIWEMEEPKFTCSPPCNVKIPPWTGATSTVNYPVLTVSDGAWTSTITKAPLTISEWVFEVVTLVDNSNKNKKRQGFDAFWPVLAPTPSWPAIVYNGPDGSATTTTPKLPFPTPSASIGPDAPPPPTGSWPKRAIQPYPGILDQPYVVECEYFDFLCINQPWLYGEGHGPYIDNPNDPDRDENWEELQTVCPTQTKTSTTTTTTKTKPPTASPHEGDPGLNFKYCYNGGENTEHVRLDNAANSFCNNIADPGDVLIPQTFTQEYSFDVNVGIGYIGIIASVTIFEGCQWRYNYDECRQYLSVSVDSCDCGGVDGKRGGWVQNDYYQWGLNPELRG
ncbi:glycoside hydrolase family 55 protein [Xylaria sp. FL0064]|nr:glycoside hydrolase family 55 protein [Xylaria sp. FL0064]